VVVSITASKESPTLCEDVTYTATTNPPGYERYVDWYTDGGEPYRVYDSNTFTTHWRCAGSKTVTAQLHGGVNKQVNVVLPTGCSEGSKSADLQASVWSTEVDCPPGPCGKTAVLGLSSDISAKYDNCKWVFQVAAHVPLESGVCPFNYVDISGGGGSYVTENNYGGIVYRFVATSGCVDMGSFTPSNTECILVHEAKHVEVFQNEFEAREAWLLSRPSMSDIAVQCSDPETTTCQQAVAARQTAIQSDLTAALFYAWEIASDETIAEGAARQCFSDVASAICSYAYTHGWKPCAYCPN
jgi:hypothetical protein